MFLFTNEIRFLNSFVNFLIRNRTLNRLSCLVGVGEATHTGHHAEDVVVERVDANLGSAGTRNRVERHSELEGRLVDTGEVAGTGRLVLLGAESKGVHVDTRGRSAAVVLVGLNAIEVRALALSETVLAVELELGDFNRVLTFAADARVEDNLGEEVVDTRLELGDTGKINVIRTDKGSLSRGVLTEESSGGGRVISVDCGALAGARLS